MPNTTSISLHIAATKLVALIHQHIGVEFGAKCASLLQRTDAVPACDAIAEAISNTIVHHHAAALAMTAKTISSGLLPEQSMSHCPYFRALGWRGQMAQLELH